MVLERRVQIGLGRMAGVPGFGKETEIGQIKMLHQVRAFLKRRLTLHALVRRVGPRSRHQDGQDAQGKEK
jgi:hypothetical protein